MSEAGVFFLGTSGREREGGLERSLGARSLPAVFNGKTQGEIIREDISKRELDALAVHFFKNKNVDLSQLAYLPPRAKAYLAGTKAFQDYIVSVAFDAAIGNERITRSQLRAVSWFKSRAVPAKSKPIPGEFEVEALPEISDIGDA